MAHFEVHKILNKLLLLFPFMFLINCTFRNDEEIFAEEICEVEEVSFSGFVKPLVQSRCESCHNASLSSGNVNLQGYDNVKVYVENNRFLGSVRHDPGFTPMPFGQSRLPNCDILKIEKWINDGFPDN
jgi:hypothetical protein